MRNLTIRVPFATQRGEPPEYSREFYIRTEDDPGAQKAKLIADTVRDALTVTGHPDTARLQLQSDEWLANQVELVRAVPDEVWDRHGLYPTSKWERLKRDNERAQSEKPTP